MVPGAANKGGRPPKGPYHGKSKTLSTRITAELRSRLEEAAGATGRSLSQEIEFRLERSFEKAADFGGVLNSITLQTMGEFLHKLETATGRPWRADPVVFDMAREIAFSVLEYFGPRRRKPSHPLSKTRRDAGKEWVRKVREVLFPGT